MLRETFKSAVIWQMSGAGDKYAKGRLVFFAGLGVRDDRALVEPEIPPSVGPTGIYLFGTSGDVDSPQVNSYYWYMDGGTGKFIRRTRVTGLLIFNLAISRGVVMSRAGAFWGQGGGSIFENNLNKFTVSSKGSSVIEVVPIEKLAPIDAAGTKLFTWGQWAIDDVAKPFTLLTTGSDNSTILHVFEWTTGKFKYAQKMPDIITSICLEDASRCYILLRDRMVVLFDYVRGEVLGAARMPPLKDQTQATNARMAWDYVYRRLLLVEVPPSNVEGTLIVRGFTPINVPHRLTKPIPLKVPRQGRIIPVLVQVVDEMNQGVGGYVVEAQVI